MNLNPVTEARGNGLRVCLVGTYPVLSDLYGVSASKISLIHHGVPDVPFVDPNYFKDQFNVEGRLVLLTFGLLNRNKGIELMLEALPDVVQHHPEVVYIMLGATHPEVKRRDGEEYRCWLERRAGQLGLEEHVIFHDRYVTLAELCEFIGACDIYVTPYRSSEQVVSGTLTYAAGMGKAVVSTTYLYAEELLADGRGRLVDFGDAKGLAHALIELIEKKANRHGMFDFIGNQGWHRHGDERVVFGQQTIEAGYTAETCRLAYEITGDDRYAALAPAAAEWLLGRNRLNARLYDVSTGACADGLDPQGASLNQGAEAVICCLLGLLAWAGKFENRLDGDLGHGTCAVQISNLGAAAPC